MQKSRRSSRQPKCLPCTVRAKTGADPCGCESALPALTGLMALPSGEKPRGPNPMSPCHSLGTVPWAILGRWEFKDAVEHIWVATSQRLRRCWLAIFYMSSYGRAEKERRQPLPQRTKLLPRKSMGTEVQWRLGGLTITCPLKIKAGFRFSWTPATRGLTVLSSMSTLHFLWTTQWVCGHSPEVSGSSGNHRSWGQSSDCGWAWLMVWF